MSILTLIELSPRQASDGVAVTLRYQHNGRQGRAFFGQEWRPGVLALPEIETDLGFDGARFGQGGLPQIGQLQLGLSATEDLPAVVWQGAAAILRVAALPPGGGDPADADFGPALTYVVDSFSATEGIARLTLIDAGQPLRRTALARRFGATGDALLDGADTIDLHGRLIPKGWGRIASVPGVLVDRAHNIWLFNDGPADSVAGFYDGGAAFSPGAARASLAALRSSSPAAGTVDHCLDADGLFLARPWTDPQYPFTADFAAGGMLRAADIAADIISSRAGLALAAGAQAAFNALHPDDAGLWLDDDSSAATALDRIFAGLGAYWRLTSSGTVIFGRLAHGAPAASFGATHIVSVERRAIVMPTRRRAVGWGANNRVHNEGEIALSLLTRRRRVYRRAASQPAPPTGDGLPAGWADLPPAADGNPLWFSEAEQTQGGISQSAWSVPIRQEGIDGAPGAPGSNAAVAYIYQRSATAPAAPTATATYTFATGAITGLNNGWSATVPAANGLPLWVRTATAFAAGATDTIAPAEWSGASVLAQDGAAGAPGTDGADGAPGLSAATVFIYQRAATLPAAPSVAATYTFATGAITGLNNGWSATVPAATGQPLWVRQASASSTGATDTIAAGEWSAGQKLAEDGAPGAPGGNAAVAYIYQRSSTAPAAPSATATYTFATGAISGLNNGWSATVPAANGQPLWVRTATAFAVGATDTIAAAEWSGASVLAQDGAAGAPGTDGADGAPGLSAATVFIYQRAATLPAAPSVAATYTFATGAITGLNNGWSATVPAATGQPLWVRQASASSTGATDTIAAGEWSAGQKLAEDGAPGAPGGNAAVAYIYQRSSTAPAAPTATATYTFATGAISGLNNGWSATVPAANGQPLWVRTATAFAAGATDTIAPAEWSGASVLAQDGAAGTPGTDGADGAPGLSAATVFIYQRGATLPAAPSATATYTFATGALAGLNNGWSASVPPATGQPLWVRQASASSTGATDTIAAGEWSAGQKLAEDGAPGADGADGAGTLPIYRRASTQPATPAPSAGVPAGWYAATGSVPAGSEPMWVSVGTRPDTASSWTWPVPTRFEAISANQTGQSVPLGFVTSTTLTFTLQPGQSRLVRGQIVLDAPTGSGTAYVQIETREQGGTWQPSNGPGEVYAVAEPVAPAHQVTITNSSAVAITYEARGTGFRTNSNSGPVTVSRSTVSI